MNHFTLLVVVLLYGTLTAQAQETETEHPYYASFTQPYKTIVKTSKGYVEVEYFPPMGRDASWQMLISPATTKWTKKRLIDTAVVFQMILKNAEYGGWVRCQHNIKP